MNRPLSELGAAQAVHAMRSGEITAEAYARALLDRAHEGQSLNAFITLEPPAVLEAARACDLRRARGEPLGRLHGLPIAIKDTINAAGLPTTLGTASLRGFRPAADAGLVAALRREGAFVMGKTNLTELGLGWTSHNETFGPVLNPVDPLRLPGGSSGGSAAAVAARMTPLALGADTLGSIRVPAALCGVAGFRPSHGRYPDDGMLAMTDRKLDQAGPLARRVEDLGLFDEAVTGDTSMPPADPRELRFGVSPFYMERLDPDVRRLTSLTLDRLRDAGAMVQVLDLPSVLKHAFETAATLMFYETAATFAHYLRHHGTQVSFEDMVARMGPRVRHLLESHAMGAHRPPEAAYTAALARRAELTAALQSFMRSHGLHALLMPAVSATAPALGESETVDVDGGKASFFEAFGRNTALGAVTGSPSVVLPVGVAGHGLPVAVELLCLPGADRALLSVAAAVEGLAAR